MPVIVIMRRVVSGAWAGPVHLVDFGRRAGESGSRPRGGRESRHFLSELQFSTKAKEEESCRGEPSLPFPGFVGLSYSGSGTHFLFLSQYDSPLAQAEKTLPGMLERLWGG